ncbi:MAG: TadE/TadG family type IV pilus assembly protein [Candidatus Dormibacteria bacterium]
MVEFALVMPVFFGAIWAVINGGFLLYSMNAVAHSALIGTDSIGAYANDPGADVYSIQRMAAAGLDTTALVRVTEIDVEELQDNPSGGYMESNGNPVIQTGCTGVRGFPATDCVDRYVFSGPVSSLTVTALDPASPCTDISQCPPWTPESRSVSDDATGQSPQGIGTSYAALVIHYNYSFFGAPAGGLSLTSTSTFRLEPQT